MRTRQLLMAILAASILISSSWSQAETTDSEQPFTAPEGLQKLLSSVDDKGAAVIGEEGKAYFEGLPSHAKRLFGEAVANEYIGAATQLRDLLSLELNTSKLEAVLTNNCLLCHSNPAYQDSPTLFSLDPAAVKSPPYMDLKLLLNDVHMRHKLACAGCHGGDPTGNMAHEHPAEWPADHDERVADPKWVPQFCGRCHSDTKLMGQFNPSLPTDQLDKYKSSHHGRALLEGRNPRAAQCVSCHGVHGIQAANSPASSVYSKRIPATCGKCHGDPKVMAGVKVRDGSPIPTDQYEQYKTSVHGKALLERGDVGAPACNDCHGNHAAAPAEVSSVAQICRTCHARNGALFDGSRHKESFEENGWPECERCHGNHAISKTSDAMLETSKGSLCADCHDKYAGEKAATCKATAAHFHDTIVGMAEATVDFKEITLDLAERGLDIEPIDDERRNLDDALKQSRSQIHSFDRSDFDEVAKPGIETMDKMESLVEAAEQDYGQRRNGLLVAAGILALLSLTLWLKIRAMERDQRKS
ncbi:MAG: cytochrome c3 family protein [Deltaproteobacteria bacterium]|nr:cytochrome c3 family protein [Deltaproteobacteria bacterium]